MTIDSELCVKIGVWPYHVLLGNRHNLQRRLLKILTEAVLLPVRCHLTIVAKEVADIFQRHGHLISEEVDDEWSREVEALQKLNK